MKLQVVVNKLNRRKSPVTDFANKSNVVDVVKSGFVFESVAQIENQLGVWHQDSDGLWASEKWLTGTEVFNDEAFIDFSMRLTLKTPITGTGNGIVVGILDSGIDFSHPSLAAAKLGEEINFLFNKSNSPLVDSHGTNVAGTIAGNDDKIKGVALNVNIVSYKVIDRGNVEGSAVLAALNHIIDNNVKVDVLNLSLDIASPDGDDFQTCINTLVQRGVVIVVAGTNDDSSLTYVAENVSGVIPVGVFNNSKSDLSTHLKVGFLNAPFITMAIQDGQQSHSSFSDSSAYTAVVTGIIARYLSSNNLSADQRNAAVLKFLENASFGIQNEPSFLSFKPYSNAQA